MRVAVCCKAVPTDVLPELIQVNNGDMRHIGSDFYINEIDEYALEAAAVLKKLHNAETWALTVGPLRSQEALYMALAKGVQNALRIEGETSHPELIAGALVAALKDIQPNLVLVGVQSEDWMGGEIGVYIAEGLGASLGFAVVKILELDDNQVRIQKELGGGLKAEMILKLPAVLCVQSGIHPLQYVSALNRRKVRDMTIKSWGKLEEIDFPVNIKEMMQYKIEGIGTPKTDSQAVMISGERSQQTKELIKIIKENLIS
jgi:electron transfer flavoprotein beta subunit